MISFQLAATMDIYKFKKAIDTGLNTQIFSQKTLLQSLPLVSTYC